jgi:hypothetical protein
MRQLLATAALILAALLLVQTTASLLERHAIRSQKGSEDFSPTQDEPRSIAPPAQPTLQPQRPPALSSGGRSPT